MTMPNGSAPSWRVHDIVSGARALISVLVVLVALIAWTVHQEERINELEHAIVANKETITALNGKLDNLDKFGSRGLQLTEASVTRLNATLEANSTRISGIERSINDVEARTLTQLHADIKRLDEQQTRILQALDTTYNTLQEVLRAGMFHVKRCPS